ncbi:MAG: hypothetical protein EOO50_04915 [Flavobacterium sp.]|uniref:hypothetical protein n=1 Tax=Flavobacterium sp. TaxID=239 RepID=UPI00121DD06B|nr:hypothetical protein [Flavobacterium sp.]RZJ67624.1 MAG: hypothetical protein EOO50_04915 [Flavobacterium sp.]
MKYLVVIATFFFLFKPVFPVVQYVIDYDYIATVLCVNKAKPELKCNGKCHLMKELAKASDSEKPASQNDKKGFTPIELFCNTAEEIVIADVFQPLKKQSRFFFKPSDYAAFEQVTFHPPAVV